VLDADLPARRRFTRPSRDLTYHSFHTAAMWTFGERERTLRRVRYRQPPEGVFLGGGTGQKCVSSPIAGDMESLPAIERKAEAPPPAIERKAEASPPAIETRSCDGCDADFRPARPWSRFCCAACRLRAHRRLAEVTRAQEEFASSRSAATADVRTGYLAVDSPAERCPPEVLPRCAPPSRGAPPVRANAPQQAPGNLGVAGSAAHLGRLIDPSGVQVVCRR
jgi:hypothetical protein